MAKAHARHARLDDLQRLLRPVRQASADREARATSSASGSSTPALARHRLPHRRHRAQHGLSVRRHDPADALHNVQTVTVPAGGGGVFDVKIDEPGLYPFVSHAFAAVDQGQVGLLNVGNVRRDDGALAS